MIRFWITAWNTEAANKLKDLILALGYDPRDIELLTDRKSRSIVMNAKWSKLDKKYKYLCLLDDDIVLQDNTFLEKLVESIKTDNRIGAVVVPCYQFSENNRPKNLESPLPAETPVMEALRTINYLTTFNCILFKTELWQKGFRFDEDIFGSQVIDCDAGFEINRLGYHVKADLRTSLIHNQTNYSDKSLAYHAVVARSRAILRQKWMDRDDWRGVDAFNAKHDNMIPTIEELTHMSENNLVKFISSYDRQGLKNCYLEPRFGGLNIVARYYSKLDEIYQKTPDEYKFFNDGQQIGFIR